MDSFLHNFILATEEGDEQRRKEASYKHQNTPESSSSWGMREKEAVLHKPSASWHHANNLFVCLFVYLASACPFVVVHLGTFKIYISAFRIGEKHISDFNLQKVWT